MSTTPRPRVRADGTIGFQVRYRIPRNGEIRATSQTFDDYTAAKRWSELLDRVGAVEAERILAAQLAAAAPILSVTEWCTRYADRLTGIEEATRQRYHRYIVNDIGPFMGSLPVDAVTEETDAAWVVHLENEVGNAAKTIWNKHGFFSAAMAAAARHRPTPLIPANPCAYTRLPRWDGPELDYLDDDEYELLVELMAPRWHAQAELMVMSMARPSEIGALTVGDIDRDTGAVSITKAWKYAGGKLKLGPPKSKRGNRTVYVPLETVARLDLDRPLDAPLMCTRNGTPITVVYLHKKAFAPAVKRLRALAAGDFAPFDRRRAHWAGTDPEALLARFSTTIPKLGTKRITPYTMRHTAISWRLQDGVPIWVVSRDAGHESISTTDKRYGHIDASASAAAAQIVANRLPQLRRDVVNLDQARRRRQVRAGDLGEICVVPGGFEAVWMNPDGEVLSQVFESYDNAVDHIADHEAGDLLAA